MKEKNICKFITESAIEILNVRRFIYESEQAQIKSEHTALNNRLMLIKGGNGRFIADGMRFSFTVGSVIFAFEGEKIYIESEDECEYFYIEFAGGRANSLFSRFCINKSSRCFDGFDGLIPLWHESLLRASEINLDLAAEGILLYTFSRLAFNANEKNNIISKIIEITEQSFNDSELSISKIADMLSYNSKYISHIFKEKMGISYSEYLRNIRIKYAVTLLEHGLDSVKNIALLSGFSDPLYFSNVFKKTIGVSPKEYKKKLTK